ncbi:cytochrome P450 [Halalkalibacter krulwichiae]|uniref:Cytochrome P450(MEG) n=1 Tax=Halalkalibacter krulwichiae TaxID=199441 RepID=A0A1X9MCR3_9BACI|nr:cytochrome P450 [Halalkalibacter krulwichiae]ARK29933.1 Cytochrome P450(MEG) [Halalkalibacter krulwichiae]
MSKLNESKCPFNYGNLESYENELFKEVKIDKRGDHDFDPKAPESFTSAHDLYKEMRSKCPVAHSNEWGGFWALSKYEDVVGVLKDYETYTTSVQNVVPKVAFTGRRPPLHFDPPEHTVYRRLINQFFTKKKMLKLEPIIQRDTEELVKALMEKDEVEIAADYSHQLPSLVFAQFFNLPKSLSKKIKEVSTAYVKAIMEFDNQEKVKGLSLQLYDIARTVIDSRKENPMDPEEDFTSALLNTKQEGEYLTDDMVLGCVRAMLVAGMIAPSVLIASIFVHLAKHKDIQEQLRNDLSLIPAATEEYLRLLTPYRGMARTAKQDVVIGGQLIKKDEPIALNYASANRDDEVFPDGDTFILNRPNINKHIVFGEGPHKCPASPLARMMVRFAIEEALKRTKDIDLIGEIKMTVWAEWGVLEAPMKLTPVK